MTEYQRLLDEVELLREIHAAVGEIDRGEGIEHDEARRLARAWSALIRVQWLRAIRRRAEGPGRE